jgi:hypothetical protein
MRLMIDTKAVEDRRAVRFTTIGEIVADAEALDRATRIRASGNWTPARIVEHVADWIEHSIDGCGARMPDDVRKRARARRDELLEGGFPAGIPIPGDRLQPPKQVSWSDALKHLRRAVGRTERERMEGDHPTLGPLSHEQWIRFHCRHAELHFSFVHSR